MSSLLLQYTNEKRKTNRILNKPIEYEFQITKSNSKDKTDCEGIEIITKNLNIWRYWDHYKEKVLKLIAKKKKL